MQQFFSARFLLPAICTACLLGAGTSFVLGIQDDTGNPNSAYNAEALQPDVLDDEFAPADDPPAPIAEEEPAIVVDVRGAVRAPDVYSLPASARMHDAIAAAGGLATDADAQRLNMAQRLRDEAHIYVPHRGEAATAQATQPDIAADAAGSGAPALDLNTASASDLEALDGIGKVLAARIVAYREANGPFRAVEDLQNVPGISKTIFAGLVGTLMVQP